MLWKSNTSIELGVLKTAQLWSDPIMQSNPLAATRLLHFQCMHLYATMSTWRQNPNYLLSHYWNSLLSKLPFLLKIMSTMIKKPWNIHLAVRSFCCHLHLLFFKLKHGSLVQAALPPYSRGQHTQVANAGHENFLTVNFSTVAFERSTEILTQRLEEGVTLLLKTK